MSVFQRDTGGDDEQFSVLDSILSLVKYVDSVCAVMLQQESGNILLAHCVLQFFELVRSTALFGSCSRLWFGFSKRWWWRFGVVVMRWSRSTYLLYAGHG